MGRRSFSNQAVGVMDSGLDASHRPGMTTVGFRARQVTRPGMRVADGPRNGEGAVLHGIKERSTFTIRAQFQLSTFGGTELETLMLTSDNDELVWTSQTPG